MTDAAALQIGSVSLATRVFTAPMAGFSDLPFRTIVRELGRCCPEGEMVSANPDLLESDESLRKISFGAEPSPRIAQLLGGHPAWMANAARYVISKGADLVDINMGCPAKKVCKTECGSALMRNEELALSIIRAVVKASTVPVMLKMRTGWDEDCRNAPRIAAAAQEAGVSLITVHGRTRVQGYSGLAEYRTIREVKAAVSIPVIANGDIDSPQKALAVLEESGADGVMSGRGVLGNPWLAGRIDAVLSGRPDPGEPDAEERLRVILRHFALHLAFYGETHGIRTFRKHLLWYLKRVPEGEAFARGLLSLQAPSEVEEKLAGFFNAAHS